MLRSTSIYKKIKRRIFLIGLACSGLVVAALSWMAIAQSEQTLPEAYQFTQDEIQFLKGFTLAQLPALKSSDTNAVADLPEAAEWGHQLFFDTRLSKFDHISCATCHQPDKYFTDGIPLAVGLATAARNTPTVVGAAYSHWQFWNGRKDSLWSQALGPIEDRKEQGASRVKVARVIAQSYSSVYERLFGALPDVNDEARFPLEATPLGDEVAQALWKGMAPEDRDHINRIFSNVGKVFEAYQRQLKPAPANFDAFVEALEQGDNKQVLALYSEQEVLGMRLFMGRANCASCHNGPLFTNFEFHNVGIPERDQMAVDLGRYKGVKQLAGDSFNCLSDYSDAKPEQCLEIRYLKTEGKELVGAFKAPSLRNVALTAPYMHAGQFESLMDVIAHYNKPKPPFFDPKQQPNRPHFDILPLRLTEEQQLQLKSFLESLTGGIDSNPKWLSPPGSLTADSNK